MKCEKCGNRDAQFYYKETVNGKTTEKHLCAECAHEDGLDRMFESRSEEMFRGFEGMLEDFFAPDPFFDGFFPRTRSRVLASPMRTMLLPLLMLPRIEIGTENAAESETTENTENKASGEKDEALCRRRELNALRHQLKEAVREENYEKAIELRDRIKELEK